MGAYILPSVRVEAVYNLLPRLQPAALIPIDCIGYREIRSQAHIPWCMADSLTVRRQSAMQTLPVGLGKGLAFTQTVQPTSAAPLTRKRSIRRRRNVQSNAFFPLMEVSVNVLDKVDMLKSTIEEEVVLEATLQVPAYHAVACRVEAYSTPFASPNLQATDPSQLSEDDKQYAACLAAPPDLEVVHSMAFKSMASILGMRHAPSLIAREELVSALASDASHTTSQAQQRRNRSWRYGDQDGDEEGPSTAADRQTSAEAIAAAATAQPQNTLKRLERMQQQPAATAAALLQAAAVTGAVASYDETAPCVMEEVPPEAAVPAEPLAMSDTAAAAAAAAADIQKQQTAFQSIDQEQPDFTYKPQQQFNIVASRADSIVIRHTVPASVVRQLGDKLVTTMLGTAYLLVHGFQQRHAPATNLLRTYTRSFTGLHGAADLLLDQAADHFHHTKVSQQQEQQQEPVQVIATSATTPVAAAAAVAAGGAGQGLFKKQKSAQRVSFASAFAADADAGTWDQGPNPSQGLCLSMCRSFSMRPSGRP